MVKTARKKYYRTMAIMLLAISVAFFVSIYFLMHFSTLKTVMENINDVEIVFNKDSNATTPPNGLYAQINVNGDYYEIINQSYDEFSFKGVDISQLVEEIYNNSKKTTSGKIDNVFYKTVKIGGICNVYACDATTTLKNFNHDVLVALIICATAYVIMLVVANAIANKIFQPIIEASNRQSQFISDASHELKTPLAIISANAEVLKTDNDPKWIANVQEQTQRMSLLIEDMLEIAKIDEDKIVIRKENFDLSEEVVNVILPFEAVVYEKKKRLVMNVEEGVRVETDRVSIRKTLEILLDNAIKYSDEKGTITVTLKKHKNRTVLIVKNTGSNVPNKDSNKIFERFYRAEDSRSREFGGSGLGLAIAKNISNANKWKIYAKSEYQQSMTITVII